LFPGTSLMAQEKVPVAKLEKHLLSHVTALEHVLIVGSSRYGLVLAGLGTLHQDDHGVLVGPALELAMRVGSPARTAKDANKDQAFIANLLRQVAQSNKDLPAQFRCKHVILLPEKLSEHKGTLNSRGRPRRRTVFERYRRQWDAAISVAQQGQAKARKQQEAEQDRAGRMRLGLGDQDSDKDSSGSASLSFRTAMLTEEDDLSAKSRTPPYLTAEDISGDEDDEDLFTLGSQ